MTDVDLFLDLARACRVSWIAFESADVEECAVCQESWIWKIAVPQRGEETWSERDPLRPLIRWTHAHLVVEASSGPRSALGVVRPYWE